MGSVFGRAAVAAGAAAVVMLGAGAVAAAGTRPGGVGVPPGPV